MLVLRIAGQRQAKVWGLRSVQPTELSCLQESKVYKVRPCLKKKIQMVNLGAYLRGLTCLLSMWKALDSIKALKTT